MKRLLPILLCLAALPARAGFFDDDEARKRIEKLRTDIDTMAQQVDLAARNQIDFANHSESLRTDMARLRGQIEVLINDLETAQKRQRDFYVDLDSRLRKLETAAPPAATDPKADAAPKIDPAQEAHDYESALGAFKAGKYKDAVSAFQSFISAHPSSALLPNAYYWTASSHYQLKDYRKAVETFAKVAATWPNDPKAPDALLAEANSLTEAGDTKGAKKVLEVLVEQYSATTAAQTAKQRLKKK
jgi:tol-pal system protein YbgF